MSKRECHFTTFLKSRISVVLIGGVLSALALALIPHHAFAYSTPIKIPGNDESYRMTATHNIMGGCMFREYELLNGSHPYLGSLLDNTNNCGYRYVNDHLGHYDNNRVGYSQAVYNGSSATYNTTTIGGYNILNTWSESVINSYGQNVYNTLNNINLNLQKCPLNAQSCTPAINLYSSVNGSAIFVYAYKSNLPTGSVGVSPRIEYSGNGWGFYNSDGSYNSSYSISDYASEVSSSLIFGTWSSEELSNLLPDDLQYMNKGDEYQYIIGSFPLYADHYLKTTTIQFSPVRGVDYSWRLGNDLSVPGVQGGVLNADGIYNFLSYPVGGSYKNQGTTINDFALSDSIFTISLCENSSECDYYSNFANMYKDMHSSNVNEPTGQSGSQSIFMSWFDVFSFGFTFPFRNFFEAFTDSQQCVSIPIIGGMLHNPNAQYCSWWSNDIRSVLTPVFSLAGIMILTGLIVHWLKGYNGIQTTKTKGGDK